VGIITGILAKEVVVGTLDSLYSSIDTEEGVNESKVSEYSLKDGSKTAINTNTIHHIDNHHYQHNNLTCA
jgi:ferrous iron transport protein B